MTTDNKNDVFFYLNFEKFSSFVKEKSDLKSNLDFLRNEIAKFYLSDKFSKISKEQFLSYKQIMHEINEIYSHMLFLDKKELTMKDIDRTYILFSIFNVRDKYQEILEIRKSYIKKEEKSAREKLKRNQFLYERHKKTKRHLHLINRHMKDNERVLFKYLKENNDCVDIINKIKEDDLWETFRDTISDLAKKSLLNISMNTGNFKDLKSYIENEKYFLYFKSEDLKKTFNSFFYVKYGDIDACEEIKVYVLFEKILKELIENEEYKHPILNDKEIISIKNKYKDIKRIKELMKSIDQDFLSYCQKMKEATKKSEVFF